MILKELKIIRGNTKGMFFLILFRSSAFFTKNKILKIIGIPIRLFYRFFIQWLLGIDIPDTLQVGLGFNVFHGQGLVINEQCQIGTNFIVRHNTTIGNAKKDGNCPQIGNNVEVGANSVIIGDIQIGDNAVIAAGSIVIRNVPENALVAGNPARIIKIIENTNDK